MTTGTAPQPLQIRIARYTAVAVVIAAGVATILGSTGSEGATDIRVDTSELEDYGFAVTTGGGAPAEVTIAVTSDGTTYVDALSFPGTGLSGNFDRTLGFTLVAGSAMNVNTDRAAPRLGSFSVVVTEDFGEFDNLASDIVHGAYTVANGTDTVAVRIIDGQAGTEFELRLNGGVPVILDWFAFSDDQAPMWQRQAADAYGQLSYFFQVILQIVFVAEGAIDSRLASGPQDTACDRFDNGLPPPLGLPNPGAVTLQHLGSGDVSAGDDFAMTMTDCAALESVFGIITGSLYRGDVALQDWRESVNAQNVLTNFGFSSVSVDGLQVSGLRSAGNESSVGLPRTLGGGFSAVFFPP